MVSKRDDRRVRGAHTFRPTLDGRLEERALLAPAAVRIFAGAVPRVPRVRTFVVDGGKGVRILDGRHDAFDVRLTGPGTVTARPTRDGLVRIIARGTDATTEMVINPVDPSRARYLGQAHTFNPVFGVGDNILDVEDIEIRSGKIGQILGFRTANLFGTIDIQNDSPIDRIAFNRLMPGATITTVGNLNTLDVFVDATLSGAGTGLLIGKDLNLLNVGGNLTIQNGANIIAGRDLGNTPQAAKGTGTGSNVLSTLFGDGQPLVSGFIQGNLTVAEGSALKANRDIDQILFVQGNVTGVARVTPATLPNGVTPSVVAEGTIS